MVVLGADAATGPKLEALESEANHGFEATCTEVEVGETITPKEDACYELHFDDSRNESTFVIKPSGEAVLAIFTAHVPTEFEYDKHYLQDADGTDIEPAHEEGGDGHGHGHEHGSGQETCGCASQEADHPFAINCTDVATVRAAGLTLQNECGPAIEANCKDAVASDPKCQIAFFVIQAHHDLCVHDTLVRVAFARSKSSPESLACAQG